MTEFKLQQEYIELIKLLKHLGLVESGGAAKEAVELCQVKVDGKVEMRKKCKIRIGQTVEFGEHTIKIIA